MDKEIWKDILDYEGIYQISSLGRVKSFHRNKSKFYILKPVLSKDGYYIVSLHKNGKQKTPRLHRLVAQAFIPNPENLPEVNHIDEDKSHNYDSNLEWCTRNYNINYGTRTKRAIDNTDYEKRTKLMDYDLIVSHTDYRKRSDSTDYTKIADKNKKRIYGYKIDKQGNKSPRILFLSINFAAHYIGGKPQSISRVLNNKRKKTKEWVFEYA